MSNRVERDLELLRAARSRGRGATIGTYVRLSGPGWLQSAITLGGGSLTGALFLGVVGGTSLLWVQLFAMVLGVVMLCAISYITLSIERSPFVAMREDVNPVLAWGWLIATAMANLIWVFPQYSLAYSAVSQNLLPSVFDDPGPGSKYGVSLLILALVATITLFYSSGNRGIRIYETVLKLIVAGIVLAFVGVVFKIANTSPDFNWSVIAAGFVPDPDHLTQPADAYRQVLTQIPDVAVRDYWTEEIVAYQRATMISATATAVAINMTFLLPYSLLNKGWNREFRGLALFDLSTGMVIPFVITVSCVAIASAFMFHGKPYAGLLESGEIPAPASAVRAYEASLTGPAGRAAVVPEDEAAISDAERHLAAMLVKRDTGAFAAALQQLTNDRTASNTIFGLGVMAMALSTTSLLMLISGYVLCEMLGKPHGGTIHRIGTLLPAIGILWPMVWGHSSGAFLAIVTSTFGYILFPVACLGFFLMMNSERILRDDMPRGGKRVAWNTAMGISLVTTGLAAGHTATTKTMGTFPIGKVALVVFVVLVIAGQLYVRFFKRR